MTPRRLVEALERRGVRFEIAGDKLRVDAPAGLLNERLKVLLTRRKAEIMALLAARHRTATVAVRPGVVVRVFPMRESCRAAGRCLILTREADCNLFPMRPGWCRERVPANKHEKEVDHHGSPM